MLSYAPADAFLQVEHLSAGLKDGTIEAVDGVGALEYFGLSIASRC
jgi:hypothetical protein